MVRQYGARATTVPGRELPSQRRACYPAPACGAAIHNPCLSSPALGPQHVERPPCCYSPASVSVSLALALRDRNRFQVLTKLYRTAIVDVTGQERSCCRDGVVERQPHSRRMSVHVISWVGGYISWQRRSLKRPRNHCDDAVGPIGATCAMACSSRHRASSACSGFSPILSRHPSFTASPATMACIGCRGSGSPTTRTC